MIGYIFITIPMELYYLNISIIHIISFKMSSWLWLGGSKWLCKSITTTFSNIKSKSGRSTTGHILLRSSLLFPHMKPKSNHKLVCAHPFLTHIKIKKGKNLIFCSVFTTTVYFEKETTGPAYFHLALGFTYKTERLSWDQELFWIFSRPAELPLVFLGSFSTRFGYTQFICQINAFTDMLWTP